MCSIVCQKTQEMYQSVIYLSIKYRAEKRFPMNSMEGETLCRLNDIPVVLPPFFFFLFFFPSPFLSCLPSVIMY